MKRGRLADEIGAEIGDTVRSRPSPVPNPSTSLMKNPMISCSEVPVKETKEKEIHGVTEGSVQS